MTFVNLVSNCDQGDYLGFLILKVGVERYNIGLFTSI